MKYPQFVCLCDFLASLKLPIEIFDFLLEVSLSCNLKRIGPDDLKKVFFCFFCGPKWAHNEVFKLYEKLTLNFSDFFGKLQQSQGLKLT